MDDKMDRETKKTRRVGKKRRKKREDFAEKVSMDMRTSLNHILDTTTALLEYITESETLDDLEDMRQSEQYLLNLLNDTEDMNKLENDTLILNPVYCDAWTTFNNILDRVAPRMKDKNISFHVEADELTFLKLYMDVERVEQILMNVLQNALTFTKKGGTINCIMKNIHEEDGVIMNRIVVEDNGIGMTEAFLPHLFEPFSREHEGEKSRKKGTGLGMTISKRVLELMGGDISVESKIGQGTSVTILLPMQVATQEQTEEWQKKQRADQKIRMLDGKHILLCEDHPLNAQIATRILESRGIIVDNVANGRLAVKKFASSQVGYYDGIMMDILMPVLNGVDATREIRGLQREDALCVPIIAITADATSCNPQETLDIGMTAHLSKPIEPDKLFAILEEVLKQKPNYIRGTVLVVDDVEVNRAVMNAMLHYRFDILEASNGREALKILESTDHIDAVITDMEMPVMDGCELTRSIRRMEKYKDMIIIAYTQYGTPEQEKRIRKLGVDDFIYKPTSPSAVEIRLFRALNKEKKLENKETEE